AVPGVRVGHVTRGGTGVTVVLFPSGSVGSVDVRGGAPATREIDVLDPLRTVERVDAGVFAGGSAVGLAPADRVRRYLGARGAGAAATVGKWRGREGAVPGGVGVASTFSDGVHVAALVVVNAVGDVIDDDGRVLAGSTAPPDAPAFPTPAPFEEDAARANT